MAKPFRSPLVGYNHNLNHRGRVFHVQTEDSGPALPRLFTHLFFEGTILVSAKHEYHRDLPDDQVRVLMRAQHKTVIKDLMQARLDERIIAFFSARGEGMIPVPGAVPQAPLPETVEPVMVLSQAEDNAEASLASSANVESEVVAELTVADAVEAAAEVTVDDRSQAYADVELGPGTEIPVAVSPRRTTRPIETLQHRAASLPASVPSDGGRAFVRSRAPAIATPSGRDGVVVQRNVVVGGTPAPAARPVRIRPPVPYVVTGGGHTERLPRNAATSASAAESKATPPKVAQQKTARPLPAQPTTPQSTAPAALTAAAASSPQPGSVPASTGEAQRRKAGFGVGRTDDKSLDEVILEYLSEDGDS